MNLILAEDIDFTSENEISLEGRRLRHIREVHRAEVGAQLRVGRVGGLMGLGEIVQMDENHCRLRVELREPPPLPLELTLYLALPRPKFLSRVLQTVSSLGVKNIHLMNSARVEKVYWSCDQLTDASVRESLLLGLEQARDTVLPHVHLHTLFKPFVEDELSECIRGTRAIVAHPNSKTPCPRGAVEHISLAVGPEGGFVPYEIEKLVSVGFEPVEIGERILKVETAVTALIARLV